MEAQKYLPASAACVLTGNPVRPEVIRAKKLEARAALGLDSRPLILSFGGSLGLRARLTKRLQICWLGAHKQTGFSTSTVTASGGSGSLVY